MATTDGKRTTKKPHKRITAPASSEQLAKLDFGKPSLEEVLSGGILEIAAFAWATAAAMRDLPNGKAARRRALEYVYVLAHAAADAAERTMNRADQTND